MVCEEGGWCGGRGEVLSTNLQHKVLRNVISIQRKLHRINIELLERPLNS